MADPKRPDYSKLINECAASVAAEHTAGNKLTVVAVEPVKQYSRSLIMGELQESKDPAYRVSIGVNETTPGKTDLEYNGMHNPSKKVPHKVGAGTDEYIDVNSGLKSLVSPITINDKADLEGVWTSGAFKGDVFTPGEPGMPREAQEGLKLLPEAQQVKKEINACVQNPAAFAKKSLLPKP